MSFFGNILDLASKAAQQNKKATNTPATGGEIYRIWFDNDPRRKSYVGQTIQGALVRIRQHIDDANKGEDACPLLDEATRRFGIQHMRYEILQDNLWTHEDLDAAEKFWIAKYNSFAPNGYNMTRGGSGGGTPISYSGSAHTLAQKNVVAAAIAETVLDRSNINERTKGILKAFIR